MEQQPDPENTTPQSKLNTHAFHHNLPHTYFDPKDGVSNVAKYADRIVKTILLLVRSIELTDEVFEDSSDANVNVHNQSNSNTNVQYKHEGKIEQEESKDYDDEEEEEDGVCDEKMVEDVKTKKAKSMQSIVQRCRRINLLLSSLSNFKYGGMSILQVCEILLKVLQLLTATVVYSQNDENENDGNTTTTTTRRRPHVKVEQVGYIHKLGSIHENNTTMMNHNTNDHSVEPECFKPKVVSTSTLEEEVTERFVLPSPARESLLSIALQLLAKKGTLRSVSNAMIPLQEDTTTTNDNNNNDDDETPKPQYLLIIHWKVLLRMLLRTAPYLDEQKCGYPPMDSFSRESFVLKRSVNLIRELRRFFHQEKQYPHPQLSNNDPHDCSSNNNSSSTSRTDEIAKEIWDMVQNDIIHNTHSKSCFRALIMLYLFHPTPCSSEYYLNIMPKWFEAWTSIDRYSDWDYMFLTLFCRASKHLQPGTLFDWGPIRKRVLTLCIYWLQIPAGGSLGMDNKSFPDVLPPRLRIMSTYLKAFMGYEGGQYQEGIDFVGKVSKLLIFCLGKNDFMDGGCSSSSSMSGTMTPSQTMKEDLDPSSSLSPPLPISSGTDDLLRFLSFVTPYFHPSNTGGWTFPLGVLLHYLTFELSLRLGRYAGMVTLHNTDPLLAAKSCQVEPYRKDLQIPPHEVVALLDAFLPLCQQAIYSKLDNVGRAGESALVYLSQIDPVRVCPFFLDFAMRALDIGSVTLSHQAPAALSALTRLILPSLRNNPSILLLRLPEILRLTLAGIDGNDQTKTIRTLIFYRSLTCFIPVGKPTDNIRRNQSDSNDQKNGYLRFEHDFAHISSILSSSENYKKALSLLPKTSLLNNVSMANIDDHSYTDDSNLKDEAALAMSDWSLAFLDRIYGLLRATGEQEKVGKSFGVASRHSSVDVSVSKNFSRILKECLSQLFASMDEPSFESALRSVEEFLMNETLPLAVKDASALCEAVGAARNYTQENRGLNVIIPLLTNNFHHSSSDTVFYRLRCLTGAVRFGGKGVLNHRDALFRALEYAFSKKDDKRIFKSGCKLLRHLASSQCECYPFAIDSAPRITTHIGYGFSLGLLDDNTYWHVPIGAQLDFVSDILKHFVYARMVNTSKYTSTFLQNHQLDHDSKETQKNFDLSEWRQTLRILRYMLRGCSGILLDSDSSKDEDLDPNELSVQAMIRLSSLSSRSLLQHGRQKIIKVIVQMMSMVATQTFGSDESASMTPSVLFAMDPKICKELGDIAVILMTRRGASFRCEDAKAVWKSQKKVLSDNVIDVTANYVFSAYERTGRLLSSESIVYKDGERGGKTVPRRLLSTRLAIFRHFLQRHSTFEIARRLRRSRGIGSKCKSKQFTLGVNFNDINITMTNIFTDEGAISTSSSTFQFAVDGYEGLMDGLFALSCHPKSQVRGTNKSAISHSISRFGWFARERVPRLIHALSLADSNDHGLFGVPSCKSLSLQMKTKGRPQRLAEVLRGLCSIFTIPRFMNEVFSSEKNRFGLVKVLSSTQDLIIHLPAEEKEKIIHFFHNIFLQFRTKFYSSFRVSSADVEIHTSCISYLIDILALKNDISDVSGVTPIEANDCKGDDVVEFSSSDNEEKKADLNGESHWRNHLLVCWFLSSLTDENDLITANGNLHRNLWLISFQLIQQEMGQPLQRIGLGLFGRLITLSFSRNMSLKLSGITCVRSDRTDSFLLLQNKLTESSFCSALGKALVYDHKFDSTVGGGHGPQWSSVVKDVLKDYTANISPKSLFPFLRISRNSDVFSVRHAQLIHALLLLVGKDVAVKSAQHFLLFAKELACSPPSEDQRNELCTSAEIFAGVSRALLHYHHLDDSDVNSLWKDILLPFLDETMSKMPPYLVAAYTDALRYAIHHFSPNMFFPLTVWAVRQTEKALSRLSDSDESNSSTDGFNEQSKWLSVINNIFVEIDERNDARGGENQPWYSKALGYIPDQEIDLILERETSSTSWDLMIKQVLPLLLNSIGHPYASCRDNIAACLFRLCNCHLKVRSTSDGCLDMKKMSLDDPTSSIITTFLSLSQTSDPSSRYEHSLTTTRRFLLYSIYLGDNKTDFSNHILPLISLAFESIKPLDDSGENISKTVSMLHAERVKGYRTTLAEISALCNVSYGASDDISKVLQSISDVSKHQNWQVRQAAAHFLRCFQSGHKFVLSPNQTKVTTNIVAHLLSDERSEVSAAAMAALTGILASIHLSTVTSMVSKYIKIANRSVMKKKKQNKNTTQISSEITEDDAQLAEKDRMKKQQRSVFFLCAAVLARPYDTPPYVPQALAALSKHSFERSAPFNVRQAVKMCCSEFKKTHMSDNWEVHRSQFSQEQLEALEDVVSTPHYYA